MTALDLKEFKTRFYETFYPKPARVASDLGRFDTARSGDDRQDDDDVEQEDHNGQRSQQDDLRGAFHVGPGPSRGGELPESAFGSNKVSPHLRLRLFLMSSTR